MDNRMEEEEGNRIFLKMLLLRFGGSWSISGKEQEKQNQDWMRQLMSPHGVEREQERMESESLIPWTLSLLQNPWFLFYLMVVKVNGQIIYFCNILTTSSIKKSIADHFHPLAQIFKGHEK